MTAERMCSIQLMDAVYSRSGNGVGGAWNEGCSLPEADKMLGKFLPGNTQHFHAVLVPSITALV